MRNSSWVHWNKYGLILFNRKSFARLENHHHRIPITHKRSHLYRPWQYWLLVLHRDTLGHTEEWHFAQWLFNVCGFRRQFRWMTMGQKYKHWYVYTYISFSGICARSSTYLCKRIGRYNKLTTGLLTPHEFYNERPYLVLLTSSHLHISSSGTLQCGTESVLHI